MVRSAAANTSLDPHLVYFGPPDNPILSLVESHGVKVVHHTPTILGYLKRIKAKFPDYPLETASGAFLRIDLPLICTELNYNDQFILYTDCDVVFLRDIPEPASAPFLQPNLFACAPEQVPNRWEKMNSGVMVMNTATLLEDHPSFRRFITAGDVLYYELFKRGPWDQQAYQLFYNSKWDNLPMEYNWKPYWGFNEDAVIVHFHGPKIGQLRNLMNGNPGLIPENLKDHYYREPDSYRKYLSRFEQYMSPVPLPGGSSAESGAHPDLEV
jgi:hypothetical protein